MACTMRLTKPMRASSHVHISSSMPIHSYQVLIFNTRNSRKEFNKQSVLLGQQNLIPVPKSSQPNDSVVPSEDDENGVSLGTMKLPPNTDLQHFDSLLFQVDKIPGGARLGFITVGDGQTEVLVYIDCLVFPATSSSGPIFRAIRNGPLKDKPPPGEPRIMRSLLQALQKSVEIARV
ncbi:uncharacterized protein LOC123211864 isoform X2 [Mangifera indica]|uniref:uncharacterized protein LOC123211864 isoform X2 n=1 Tax=Mangifera indica TaxID=29780 RepID=UPI001CFA5F9B|nr:uncharacterized protein LOC123211864 isoform X2 [Mangifera indica]